MLVITRSPDLMRELKLVGMRAAYDKVLSNTLKRGVNTFQPAITPNAADKSATISNMGSTGVCRVYSGSGTATVAASLVLNPNSDRAIQSSAAVQVSCDATTGTVAVNEQR